MGSIIFIYFVDQNLEKNYQEFFRTLVYKAYGSVDQFNLKDEPSSFLSNTSRLLSTSFKGENIEVGNNKLNVLNFNAIPGDGIDDSRAFKKALTIASNFSSICTFLMGNIILIWY